MSLLLISKCSSSNRPLLCCRPCRPLQAAVASHWLSLAEQAKQRRALGLGWPLEMVYCRQLPVSLPRLWAQRGRSRVLGQLPVLA
jgi:hypothetical protein